MRGDFSVLNKTKSRIPIIALPAGRQALSQIKKDILGGDYSLSVVFVGGKKSQELNRTYRGKNKPANVLSFALSKKEGEIVICPAVAKLEAKSFDKTYRQFLGFLVIHGMLHLKGMEHSSRMERAEEKYDKKYFSRNRHRLFNYESHSGRIYKRRKKS